MEPDVLRDNFERILGRTLVDKKNERPSEWMERNRIIMKGPFPGPFRFAKTPYLREIVDRLSAYDPVKSVAVMKAAQIGFSTGTIENGIPWIISEQPDRALLLSGGQQLSKEMMVNIDEAIDSCGIRHLIRTDSLRKSNQRTGDTSESKEFPSGSLIAGSANNHNLLRQRPARYIFVDDFDGVKMKDAKTGSTRSLIEQRMAAYYSKMKLFMISTPEEKETSNIYEVYKLGDERRYHVPCPICGEMIVLDWEVEVDEYEKAGMYWETDEKGRVKEGSVGYVCQCCSNIFTDKNKMEMLQAGEWRPTSEAMMSDHVSYHISALYAPHGMFTWHKYVERYLQANPEAGEADVAKHRSFMNTVLGLPWEDEGAKPQASQIMANTRQYEPGTVPEKKSLEDGNGKIVILTCAADLNGKVDDARLDWEIVAWSETGTSYSVDQGSIGTFVRGEGQKEYTEDRELWTYRHGKSLSVWKEFDKIIAAHYPTEDGSTLPVFVSGIDAPGHFASYAYQYLETSPNQVLGLKGKDSSVFIKVDQNRSNVSRSKERNDLYLVEVNFMKDELAQLMRLHWDPHNDPSQPKGFMNFPEPSYGKYTYKDFFCQFEAEKRVVKESESGSGAKIRWEKLRSNVENHFWDVRIYNMALRDIVTQFYTKQAKIDHGTWDDFASLVLGEEREIGIEE